MTDGGQLCTERTPRVVAARKLHRRVARERAGRFLAEGPRAVEAALSVPAASPPAGARGGRPPVRVFEVFVTPAAAARNPRPLAAARAAGVTVSLITERAAAALSETVTPPGLVAVCGLLDVPLAGALSGAPRLVAVLVGASEPGNVGTVIRVADAAGADAVLLAGDSVDPHNGKCVRASAGSLFHLPVARERDVAAVLSGCREVGLRLLAATPRGEHDLHDPAAASVLSGPCAWLFGSEAHGLSDQVAAAADDRIRVPIYGRAESLNLATASAVCIYAAARLQRGATISPDAAR
jgi:RNA methyltransferase, TrmH family